MQKFPEIGNYQAGLSGAGLLPRKFPASRKIRLSLKWHALWKFPPDNWQDIWLWKPDLSGLDRKFIRKSQTCRKLSGLAKIWLSRKVVCSLVPSRIIWPDISGCGRIIRPRRIIRPQVAGLSGLSDSNGSNFGRGINTPPLPQGQGCCVHFEILSKSPPFQTLKTHKISQSPSTQTR